MYYVVEFLALKGYSGYIGQMSVILHVKMWIGWNWFGVVSSGRCLSRC